MNHTDLLSRHENYELRLAKALPSLIDDHVGVINSINDLQRTPGAPNFFYMVSKTSNTLSFTKQKNFAYNGGASIDRDIAIFKAAGEAIERYCSAIYRFDDLPLCSSRDACFSHSAPELFALYNRSQYQADGFPWHPFNEDTPVRWTKGTELGCGDDIWVPASMVYAPYQYHTNLGEIPFVQNISTGMACHGRFSRAALTGLYEVVERDAFTITWQARLTPPKINLGSLPPDLLDIVTRFTDIGSQVTLFDITLDHGICTILAVIRSTAARAPAMIFAAAASLNPAAAVRSALEEAAHTRRYGQELRANMRSITPGDGFQNIAQQADHVCLYTDPANTHFTDFLFKHDIYIEFNSIKNMESGNSDIDLKFAADLIRRCGHRVIVCDLTTSDIATFGLSVVRVIIPGFHPLFMGHINRASGGARLREVPKLLGYLEPPEGRLENPYPHPYP